MSNEENKETEYSYTYIELLKKFYKHYLSRYKKEFFGVQFLHIIGAVLVLIPPLIMREIIDGAIPAGNVNRIFGLVGIALAVFVADAIVKNITIFHGHRIAQEIVRDMRDDLYQQYQRLSMKFHDNKKTGELMSRIVDDLNKLQEFIHHGPEAMIGSVVLLGGTVIIMLTLDVKLTLVTLTFVPFLFIFAKILIDKMHKAFRKTRKAKADLNDRLEDNLAGIKVIKAFASEDSELERFRMKTQQHTDYRLVAIRYISILFPGSRLFNAFGVLAVLSYGGYLSATGAMTVGTIVAFYGYLQQFREPLLRLVTMSEGLSDFFANTERYFDHSDLSPDITKTIGGKPGKELIKGRVEFKNVNFSYNDDEVVLNKISLKSEPEETVALVGPSGAGKTSIVRLIPRLYEVEDGEVLIDGKNVKDYSVRELRNSIAMVMQDDYLFSDTVRQNISYGKPGASEEEIIEAAKAANAHDFITDFKYGYDQQVGQRGLMLSGGQRQRVALARAFLKDPGILILDEATSAVDLETEKLIQDAVKKLTSSRTTFVIAHRLSTIVNADKIIFIEDGKVKEEGNHNELMDLNGEYARFYKMQFDSPAAS
ncbi:MAG: ABC transporter ATP-binding protein [Bacillota bacterium]